MSRRATLLNCPNPLPLPAILSSEHRAVGDLGGWQGWPGARNGPCLARCSTSNHEANSTNRLTASLLTTSSHQAQKKHHVEMMAQHRCEGKRLNIISRAILLRPKTTAVARGFPRKAVGQQLASSGGLPANLYAKEAAARRSDTSQITFRKTVWPIPT